MNRDEILSTIRSHRGEERQQIELNFEPIQFENKIEAFQNALQLVGGLSAFTDGEAESERWVKKHFGDSKNLVHNFKNSKLPLIKRFETEHDADCLDVLVTSGDFAVAENGAIWVSGSELCHRSMLFLTQHLILRVKASQFISNMHEAYGRISLKEGVWGGFISGPSKTADIEQSLVIGAHGACSLNVLIEKDG